MKISKFFALGLSAFMLVFASCGSDDSGVVSPTAITLSSTTISVTEGAADTLTATLTPTDATGTITWASQNTAVATVNGGIVTGVAEGTTTIVATCGSLTATCAVTVSKAATENAALKGSDYYLIYMDDATATSLGSKVVADLRTDDVTKFLYVWDNTYAAGTCVGPNAFGEVDNWIYMIVQSVGWSGLGFNCQDMTLLNKLAEVTNNPNDYYLHIAIKGTSATSHLFGIDGTAGSAKVVLGPKSFTDNGTTYQPYADYTKDGEWNQIDIPVSYLTNQGLSYTTGNTAALNIFWALSGGVQGTELQIDGIFFYKKAAN